MEASQEQSRVSDEDESILADAINHFKEDIESETIKVGDKKPVTLNGFLNELAYTLPVNLTYPKLYSLPAGEPSFTQKFNRDRTSLGVYFGFPNIGTTFHRILWPEGAKQDQYGERTYKIQFEIGRAHV